MNEFTPIMKQYLSIKKDHKDKILFFELGDFYEFFFDDAIQVSDLLALSLTSRGSHEGKKIPMAGFPKQTANHYIKKLIKKNKKIAICKQINNNKKNGLIERKVTKIITPGTFIDETENENLNYICSIIKTKNEYGIAFLEITTNNFFTHQVKTENEIENEIDKIMPKEIIIEENIKIKINENILINKIKEKKISYIQAKDLIKKIIKKKEIKKNEKKENEASTIASGILIEYILETKNKIYNIEKIDRHENQEILKIDYNSRRNLEIIKKIEYENNNSLIETIDLTSTAMGKRLLKTWIMTPTTCIEKINKRLKGVSILKKNQIYKKIEIYLKKISDLDKLIYKINLYKINGHEIKKLQISLENISKIKEEIKKIKNDELINEIYLNINNHEEITNIIKNSIIESPSTSVKEGKIIKDNYDEKLDFYRNFINNINFYIENYKKKEIERIKFNKLKISFNSKEGYFIDIPEKFKNIPDYYKKIKKLSHSNRYKTKELEELEKNIIEFKNKSLIRESRLYMIIIYKIKKQIKLLKNTTFHIATLDIINSFSKNSSLNNWVEPKINKKSLIIIKEGRHPIIEQKINTNFIPNDIYLDNKKKTIIITGANMGGKSTYMRQTALIILLAYIGSHVPAKEATIGKITKIITRIGANDDIINENSTFMLEMKEISNIFKTADKNSLVLIDEIGRGTNHIEGKALALSILNELKEKINPFILFSTHFHDLTNYIKKKNNIKNIFFKTIETNNKIIFLYKWENGISNKSFSLYTAEKAGININIINEAKKYIDIFSENLNKNVNKEILKIIKNYNPDLTTPLDASKKLYLIKKILDN